MSLSLSLRDASALALLVLPVGAASLQGEGALCPETNCHLPRWAPPGLAAGDLAGEAVAIDGDLAALGLPGDDVVRTYRRENATWVLDQELPTPGAAGGEFGRELSLLGDRLLDLTR